MGRTAADLVLHAPPEMMIEAKQLHLKDGCRFAAPNLVDDLRRHEGRSTLGVIYIVDERLSASLQRFVRFANANRKVIDCVLGRCRCWFEKHVQSRHAGLIERFIAEVI